MFDLVYDNLYIGESEAIRHQAAVRREGITTIIRLDEIPREQGHWSADFTVLDIPILDGEYLNGDTIDTITAFIEGHLEAGEKVLVHCHMGISRSVSLVMAYLIAYEGMSLAEAFGTVREGRAVAYPHEMLLVSLIDHFSLPYDTSKVYNPQFLADLITDV
ncbi:MAG: hypothetical protein OHK0046_34360 [Anaerolineae bacterium]